MPDTRGGPLPIVSLHRRAGGAVRKRGRLLALLIPGALAVGWLISSQGSGQPRLSPDEPVPVTAALATRRDVPLYLEGVGAVQAYRTVNAQPQVDGPLVDVAFAEGQEVHAGDILGRIDPRPYQAALDQAEARKAEDEALLLSARKDAERSAALAAKNYTAAQTLDAARAKAGQLEAAVKGDAAAVEAARIRLGYTTIRTPIDGRIGIRQVDPGNIMHATSPDSVTTEGGGGGGTSGIKSNTLAVITQIHPISVVFTLPQDALPRLLVAKAGGPLEVAVYGRGGEALDRGRLDVIDNQVDAATGMVRLKATMPNSRNLLWPGQFINARLLVETHTRSVTVPALAVQTGETGEMAFVVNGDSSVAVRKIRTGIVDGDVTEILDGINEGESVVVAGQYRLRSGSKVVAHSAQASTAELTAGRGSAP
jgi:multidrug efflux system membrane fusion protein